MRKTKNRRWWYWLKAFIFPSYWLMNQRYSKAWDREIRLLLDTFRFTNVGTHEARLGARRLWIANHPYNSFVPSIFTEKMPEVRPSRATIQWAWDCLMEDCTTAESRKVDELEKMFGR